MQEVIEKAEKLKAVNPLERQSASVHAQAPTRVADALMRCCAVAAAKEAAAAVAAALAAASATEEGGDAAAETVAKVRVALPLRDFVLTPTPHPCARQGGGGVGAQRGVGQGGQGERRGGQGGASERAQP